MVIATAWWGFAQRPKTSGAKPVFNWMEAKRSLWDKKWDLLLPVVAFVSLLSGWADACRGSGCDRALCFWCRDIDLPGPQYQ
jgi:TRAP-type C4-dicarboxylate transport system permease large subunit